MRNSEKQHFTAATAAKCCQLSRGGVAAIVTDPPYGIAYQTGWRKVMDTPDLLANDTEAPLWSVSLMYDKLEDGGAIYLCTRFDVAHQWQQALTDAGPKVMKP